MECIELYKYADRIITDSNSAKNDLVSIFDIDKDIIVDDNIINSFEVVLNRSLNNNYKDEECVNNNFKKIDKLCIEAVIRQNKY